MRVVAIFFLLFHVASATTTLEKLVHTVQIFKDIMQGRHSQSREAKYSSLEVIGAGFPRTGTKSIEQALALMGHRIYDFRSLHENGHRERWILAAQDYVQRNDTTILAELVHDLEKLGYTATLDIPLFLFAEPMAQLRPQAKVLLSIRDNAEVWFRSWVYINMAAATYWDCRPWKWFSPNLYELFGTMHRIMLNIHQVDLTFPSHKARPLPWYEYVYPFGENHTNFRREEWITAYNAHNQHIRHSFPDRTLVFNVKQGWDPLVDFLDFTNTTELPKDFPYVNERKILELGGKLLQVIAIGFPVFVGLILVLLGRLLGFFYTMPRVSIQKRRKFKLQ